MEVATKTELWYTAKETAELIGCSPGAVYRMAREGLIYRRNLPVRRKYWGNDVRRVAGFPDPQPETSHETERHGPRS